MNLGGDVLNYGVCRLFIDVSHPMPLQFRSVFKKNPHSELIVGLVKTETESKVGLKERVDNRIVPAIFDDVVAIY